MQLHVYLHAFASEWCIGEQEVFELSVVAFLPGSQRRFWARKGRFGLFSGARTIFLLEISMGPNKGGQDPDFPEIPTGKLTVVSAHLHVA